MVKKRFWFRKNFVKKNFDKKIFGKRNFAQNISVKKKVVEIVFLSKNILIQNCFGSQQKLFGTKNLWFNEIGSEFFNHKTNLG